jgi:hypothetical protein
MDWIGSVCVLLSEVCVPLVPESGISMRIVALGVVLSSMKTG